MYGLGIGCLMFDRAGQKRSFDEKSRIGAEAEDICRRRPCVLWHSGPDPESSASLASSFPRNDTSGPAGIRVIMTNPDKTLRRIGCQEEPIFHFSGYLARMWYFQKASV
jgi:hypothetical protein